ncbi:MAG: hypothetical protein RI572_06890 [Salegentibacter sp.]|uniref:Nitrogen regulatory protein P-II family n=1 Tax=Salegentibacter flavus TaxID=287099 RepID=A0A1I5AF05_9FLAO|nr:MULTISPECIES: hypothetical protein [Salegentibacter]MDR9457119.1 hypothetical protein [Salegentibacter sp.]SFN61023.1 hypothetical protein SAMN05660413_01834 [Salegentibacter flavus]
MKLLMVTTVAEYQKGVLKLFKEAGIEAFSTSEIDGYKSNDSLIATQSWFPSEKGGSESLLYFSFTKNKKIDEFFKLVEEYNKHLETDNPIRVVVVPVERAI